MNPCWKKLWKLPVTQRIRVFMWLVFSQCLLTNAERARRHLTTSNSCPLCHNGIENIEHVVRTCSKAQRIWEAIVDPTKIVFFSNLSFQEWLCQCFGADSDHQNSGTSWAIHSTVICWMLWKQRCNTIFGNTVLNDATLVRCSRQAEDSFYAAHQ
ncbi:hypothetical protein V6N13_038690 [Hibiscus sabdariffa]